MNIAKYFRNNLHFVTMAVTEGVKPEVKIAIFGLKSLDCVGTMIVPPTTLVRGNVVPKVIII